MSTNTNASELIIVPRYARIPTIRCLDWMKRAFSLYVFNTCSFCSSLSSSFIGCLSSHCASSFRCLAGILLWQIFYSIIRCLEFSGFAEARCCAWWLPMPGFLFPYPPTLQLRTYNFAECLTINAVLCSWITPGILGTAHRFYVYNLNIV